MKNFTRCWTGSCGGRWRNEETAVLPDRGGIENKKTAGVTAVADATNA
jgi:hypothetical protein